MVGRVAQCGALAMVDAVTIAAMTGQDVTPIPTSFGCYRVNRMVLWMSHKVVFFGGWGGGEGSAVPAALVYLSHSSHSCIRA